MGCGESCFHTRCGKLRQCSGCRSECTKSQNIPCYCGSNGNIKTECVDGGVCLWGTRICGTWSIEKWYRRECVIATSGWFDTHRCEFRHGGYVMWSVTGYRTHGGWNDNRTGLSTYPDADRSTLQYHGYWVPECGILSIAWILCTWRGGSVYRKV